MPARASTCARIALKRLHHLRGSHSTRSRTTCLRWFQNEPRGHHRGPARAASHLPGPILQGPLPFQLPPFVRTVTDEETKPAVAALVAKGVDFIEVGDTLTRAAYFGIAEESRRLGVPFAGHLTPPVTVSEAARAGQRSIEHFGSAGFLGRLPTEGTIEVGKKANLVLLDANPLEDIRNT
jgi:hypothetical protein